jgi:protein-S-isoprenylcysteine O-methyltransferase Ste14
MPSKKAGRGATRHRDDLTGEHRLGGAGQLVIFLAFMAVWITDSFFFEYSSFLNNYIPFAAQITLGIICLAIAGCLAITGLKIVFVEVMEEPGVIRKSVFRIVRHPIYMGEILLYLGLLFFSTSLAAVGVWIVIIAFLHYISRHEEKLLLERFGDDYRQYMKDVPMYFPRLRRRVRN